ncbi:cation diffusion facilitator family transporter [Acaryochloris sp. CCMEE 5410]|uniref:cation diffusion facilitator family transporter n=1 Tax=Acaryochloris sp. CCMEE 5410 TaxID=310037 RepID=UPI0002484A7E|nr:cation diffusion facilitator family transporter [Acaryochloris sp. CCMEE 5410]KAI9133178.1 cation transporter [Acaryochloris sp. CCMEE 5410]
MSSKAARAYILLSIAAALITMVLKFGAYQLTSSVGLFSDVAESSVNLIAALAAFWALTVAAQPPDQEHTFGHSKAEYFSSGLEGLLILVAAISIAITAIPRLFNPQPLAELELGLGLSILSSLVNAGVAWVLLRAGKRLRSITLRADAHHLLTDVWTSVGVVAGLVIVKLTGWLILDPIMALLVALNIAWVSSKLIRETMSGLMDSALPEADQAVIRATLTAYQAQGIQFHALRTRVAGARNFVSFHVLVPGNWSVQKGHELCDILEQSIMTALPGTHVMTHLEPIEDPVSWEDAELDRSQHP